MAKKINSMPYNLQLEDLIDFFNFCESTTRKLTRQPGTVYEDRNFKASYPAPTISEWYYCCFYRK